MKYFWIVTLLLFSNLLQAQNKQKKLYIGINFGTGDSEMVHFGLIADDGGNYSKNYKSVGVSFLSNLSKSIDLETGITITNHPDLSYSPPFYPGRPDTMYYDSKTLVAIPVLARIHFWKYFFINPGLVFSIDPSKQTERFDNQSGIGLNLGFGAQYDFDFGLSLFANPYLRFYTMPISFSGVNYPEHLTESGFRFGIMYRLTKGD